jgi:signal peptidase II
MNKSLYIWKAAYLIAAAAICLLDQVSKAWAIRKLRFSGDYTVIQGLLNFSYAENSGVAFSQLSDHGEYGRWGLSGIAIIAAIVVTYFFWKTPKSQDRLLGAFALLIAGIVGNVTDRIRLGFVIDFIDVQFGSWHYPTFNIADAAICVGAVLLLIDMFFSKKEEVPSSNMDTQI